MKQMNKWTNEQINKWTNEQINEWTNAHMKQKPGKKWNTVNFDEFRRSERKASLSHGTNWPIDSYLGKTLTKDKR